ncbi:ABC-2 type transporter [Acholeplasma oculi]|uniref:ABC-2 type transporter n=1 Tax=Acholeplasma oculi TaxID=35623 RepID=A0A061ABV1_9MOLU|nr:ABC transporter permease [Acholeplasma oculi]CDR30889.1 ABC-2 type transporter [Acholeplasma oculi]SKC35432.1 fluoroquinolone transport system permease protein [Acholeplasma oculi]SUT90053.1 ABC-2 type transporter [Acholeplasma oculi]
MTRMLFLIQSELVRLNKYKVTLVSFLVALVWFLLLFFIEDKNLLNQMLPFIITVDATMMSILFIGSVMFFEKSEQTVSTILVTPTTYHEQILSKVISNTVHMMLSSLLILLVFYFLRGVTMNLFIMIPVLIISIFLHSLLGFVFSYHSKDFTSMLMLAMMYSFIFLIPSVLYQFNIFFTETFWKYILILSPSQAASYLMEWGFSGVIEIETIVSLIYLVSLSILGYIFYVFPKYKYYAVKQSGV